MEGEEKEAWRKSSRETSKQREIFKHVFFIYFNTLFSNVQTISCLFLKKSEYIHLYCKPCKPYLYYMARSMWTANQIPLSLTKRRFGLKMFFGILEGHVQQYCCESLAGQNHPNITPIYEGWMCHSKSMAIHLLLGLFCSAQTSHWWLMNLPRHQHCKSTQKPWKRFPGEFNLFSTVTEKWNVRCNLSVSRLTTAWTAVSISSAHRLLPFFVAVFFVAILPGCS